MLSNSCPTPRQSLRTVEQQFEEYHQSVQTKQSALDLVVKALQECRTAIAEYREKHTAAFSDSTRLENQLHVLQSKQTTAESLSERSREQLEHAESVSKQLESQFALAEQSLRQFENEARESQQQLASAQTKLRERREELAQAQRELADLQGRLTGARERAIVLEELERRLDGLSAGTKEVLRLAKEQPERTFWKGARRGGRFAARRCRYGVVSRNGTGRTSQLLANRTDRSRFVCED